ncbi:hypothetical protein [Xanthomonas phaseoli]|uniref:hypothetical protein n=1 Tax=Xanthomonas phaseoli TaxID=1985254 RepID=UPI00126768CC|nr:hypothetical protein [Xanthomonas phaseoli]
MDAEGQIEDEMITPERTRTPLEEAFFWTLGRARDLSFQTRLDEESLTSFLLSGVTVVTPLLIDLLGSGSEVAHECRWGPFKKAATANDPLSEAATGSDFVMVTAGSEGNVRLAIFQAKKGVARRGSETWELSVRRDPGKTASPNRQLVMLMGFGDFIFHANSKPMLTSQVEPGFSMKLVKEMKRKLADGSLNVLDVSKNLGWIHYLVYAAQDVKTVAVSKLSKQTIEAEFSCAESVVYPLDQDDQDFFSLMEAGISGEGQGWLTLSNQALLGLLPALVNLGEVYVVDGKGSRAWMPSAGVDQVVNHMEERLVNPSTPQQLELWRTFLPRFDFKYNKKRGMG